MPQILWQLKNNSKIILFVYVCKYNSWNKQLISTIVFWSITGSLNVDDHDFISKTHLTNIKYLDEALNSGKNVVIGKRAVPNGVKVDVAPIVSHM